MSKYEEALEIKKKLNEAKNEAANEIVDQMNEALAKLRNLGLYVLDEEDEELGITEFYVDDEGNPFFIMDSVQELRGE